MTAILYEEIDHIALITLNRPKVYNSQSPELVVRLDEACAKARDNSNIRVIIIAASGHKAFCTGGDLKLMIPLLTGSRKASDTYDRRVLEMTREKDHPLPINGDVGKPLIAAVEGMALGGGLELVLACDLIVAGENASFGAPEVKAGAYPSRLTFLLPQRLPYSKSIELLLTGSMMSAEDAFRLGMVSNLSAAGSALEASLELAERIAKNAPLAVQSARNVALKSLTNPIHEIEKLDMREAVQIYKSEDAREGPRAFAEKRKPDFKGR